MPYPNLPAPLIPNLDFRPIRDYVQRYWFRILLIGLALYVLMVKDINFQLSMNSANPTQEQLIPADFWEKETHLESATNSPKSDQSTALSMVSSMVTGGVSAALPVKKKATKSNVANTFSNLTFVLSPTYAKRKNIPQEVVDEKVKKCQAYIDRFSPVAISEMKKFGIPASITIAQGLLESNVGESRLTKANNNHFGIKCFSKKCGKGHCSNFTDDTHKDFFRVYQSAWESFRAHSSFLQGKRYQHLKKLGSKDYKGWAHGLRKAGYATDKKYAQKLIQIIDFLNLHQYDK